MKLSARQDVSEVTSIDDRIMPLINIVFLLLIFFLVAGVIREAEPMEVEPPRSTVEAESITADLTIYIGSDGGLALNETMMAKDAFAAELMSLLAGAPDRTIRIVADRDVETTKVVEILEMLRAAGATKVKLTTRMQDAP